MAFNPELSAICGYITSGGAFSEEQIVAQLMNYAQENYLTCSLLSHGACELLKNSSHTHFLITPTTNAMHVDQMTFHKNIIMKSILLPSKGTNYQKYINYRCSARVCNKPNEQVDNLVMTYLLKYATIDATFTSVCEEFIKEFKSIEFFRK